MPVVIGAKRESDFTDPVGMLGDCHRRILRFLQVLVTLTAQESEEALTEQQAAALTASLQYFRVSAPKHTADEEESLFPRLRRLGTREAAEVLARIDSLEHDHQIAERHHAEVDRLGSLWLGQGRLSSEDAAALRVHVNELADLYRQHIAAEDTEVFPFAAAALSAGARQEIGAEMAARRGLKHNA